MGRPPIQHHKHIISLAPETLEVLEDLQGTFIKGKVLGALGEASEGVLSNPNLAFLVGGGIMAALAAYVGKDALENINRYFGAIGTLTNPEASQEEKNTAASEATDTLREIIKFFSPLGPLTPLP